MISKGQISDISFHLSDNPELQVRALTLLCETYNTPIHDIPISPKEYVRHHGKSHPYIELHFDAFVGYIRPNHPVVSLETEEQIKKYFKKKNATTTFKSW